MQQSELELSVGDVLRVGNHLVTVVEIHEDEVIFKVVDAAHLDGEFSPVLRPR
ncbi:MAG TPA: hypothetical protein VFG20_15540 [Planctomycetaceae bacterium]|nr:hypothetical protein [Planctomycetaceae bacterium]